MTALKPSESLQVVGVKDGQIKLLRRLILNQTCSKPDCHEPTYDAHHIWPRSLITNDSWFVKLIENEQERILPNVTGLCRPHHDDVEEHRAWIKLEEGDVFVWYERDIPDDEWSCLGPLWPQPGQVIHKAKRRKKVEMAEAADDSKQQTWTIRAPKGESIAPLKVLVDQAREVLDGEDANTGPVSVLSRVLYWFTTEYKHSS